MAVRVAVRVAVHVAVRVEADSKGTAVPTVESCCSLCMVPSLSSTACTHSTTLSPLPPSLNPSLPAPLVPLGGSHGAPPGRLLQAATAAQQGGADGSTPAATASAGALQPAAAAAAAPDRQQQQHQAAAADVPVRIRLLTVADLATEVSFQGDPLSRPRWGGWVGGWVL